MLQKKHTLYIGIASFAILLCLGILLLTHRNSSNKKVEEKYTLQMLTLETNESNNVYTSYFEDKKAVYNAGTSRTIRKDLDYLLKSNPTFDHPLWAYNPFGTNFSSFYLAYTTKEPTYLEYTISVDDDSIGDFTRKAYISDNKTTTTTHEYSLIGFIPGMTNTVTLKQYKEDGSLVSEYSTTLSVPDVTDNTNIKLATTEGTSKQELSDGLFTMFSYGTASKGECTDILLYDNNGVLRSKLPIVSNYTTNLLQVGDTMVYAFSTTTFASISPLGQVLKKYKVEDALLHHDYIYNEELNEIWALASSTTKANNHVEDIIVAVSLDTKETRVLVDFDPLISDLSSSAIVSTANNESDTDIDWLHLNSLCLVDSDTILVSARELSSIIKVSNLKTAPKLDYVIADDFILKDTSLESLLLTKDTSNGSFAPQYGQHYVQYEESEELEDGSYYVTLYDNNSGWSYTRPDLDWSGLTDVGTKLVSADGSVVSHYYKYLVNENAGTYRLVDSISVPYSGIVSSAQSWDGNYVILSGKINTLGEYDSTGTLIRQYIIDGPELTYRTMKYSYQGFWFQ